MIKRRHFHWAFLFLIALHFPDISKACDCDPNMQLEDHYEAANVVVLGTCIDVTTNPIKGGLNVVFKVDSSWKRKIEHIATFHTTPGSQCGFDFKKGERYFVFGMKRHQTIETGICQPNALEKANGALMRRFGKGYGPGRPQLAKKMNLMLVVLFVLGLLFVAFVVLRKRIMRPRGQQV